MDTYPISSNSLEKFFYINGDQLGQQYKDHLSDYRSWNQKDHACEWILFSENMGHRLSIDETSLSNGELYTILTNKDAHGQKGTIVAMIDGTTSEVVEGILNQIPQKLRNRVTEITLDMAGSMNIIARHCFPNLSVMMRYEADSNIWRQEHLTFFRWFINVPGKVVKTARKVTVKCHGIIGTLTNGGILSNGYQQLAEKPRRHLWKHYCHKTGWKDYVKM